jgi:ankyrin repeat protein
MKNEQKTHILKNLYLGMQATIAINEDNNSELLKLINKGLNPNEKIISNSKEISLLIYAIKQNKPKAVEALLLGGANSNMENSGKESFTIRNGITEYNSKKSDPAFYLRPNKEDIEFEIEQASPLMIALNKKSSSYAQKKEWLSDSLEKTQKIVSLLIENGANIEYKDPIYKLTPLHFAANQCEPELVKILLEKGANPNVSAINEGYPLTVLYRRSYITPVLLATNKKEIKNSSECLDILTSYGSDIKCYSSKSRYFSEMTSLLHNVNQKKAEDILFDVLDKDYERISPANINNILETYLQSKHNSDNKSLECVEIILNHKFPKDDLYNDIKYLTHANSWSGPLPVKFTFNLSGNNSESHLIEEGSGWILQTQIPKKIKNLMQIMYGVAHEKINSQKLFDEPKEEVLKKLRSEIIQQANIYYTTLHVKYECDLVTPEKYNGVVQGEWPYEKTPDLREKLSNYLTKKWADRIHKLNIGESFAISANPKGHSVILDFKKDTQNTLTRNLYNVGGASFYKHPCSLDGRLFPHSVKNIPAESFDSTNSTENYQKGLDYLKTILTTSHYSFRAENTLDKRMLHPELNKVYEGVFNLGKANEVVITLDKLIPSKTQLTTNCSYKSNMVGFRNRIQNDKLYKFTKNFEILSIKNDLQISSKVIRIKELEKDVNNIAWHLLDGANSPKFLEYNLFKFFSKRAPEVSKELANKPGDRIASLISNMYDKEAMEFYINGCPSLINILDKVAKEYKSKYLYNLISEYCGKYEISSKHQSERISSIDLLEKLNKESKSTVRSLVNLL